MNSLEINSLFNVPRKLWFDTRNGERVRISDDQLSDRPESLVVLGEPGMGKTQLLKVLAEPNVAKFCTARQLINRPSPQPLIGDASILIIDALDEVSARYEGDAVDLVLQKLGMLNYPRFILSCRVADWQAATSVAAFQEQYEQAPLQLHLEPLTAEDQIAILAQSVSAARANELFQHFEKHGLDFLGNPQTLQLIARLPIDSPLPETSGPLFELAIEKLRVEHRDGAGESELPREIIMDAAGAAFATLILSGSTTIKRTAQANLSEGELPFTEINDISGGNLTQAIGTRLFSGENDSFSYWHRRIGEFLGAYWLAAKADTPMKRRRLLKLFHDYDLVPTNLRGLHAWLSRDPNLASFVVSADPMGVLEYGDADSLTPQLAGELFRSLEGLAHRNPSFWRGGNAKASSLVSSVMRDEADRVMLDKEAPSALRLLLVEQLVSAELAELYRETLLFLLTDEQDIFVIRRNAATALAKTDFSDWPVKLQELIAKADQSSLRIAYEAMCEVGFEAFSDQQIVDVVLAYGGLTVSVWPQEESAYFISKFLRLPELISDDRLASLLDIFSEHLEELLPHGYDIEFNDLVDALHALVLRCLEISEVDASKVWAWLKPAEDWNIQHRQNSKVLAEKLRSMDDVRRSIQRSVLLGGSGDRLWRQQHNLRDVNPGLVPDESDIIFILSSLTPNEVSGELLMGLATLVAHDEDRGEDTRRLAIQLAGEDHELCTRISNLASPAVPEWQINEDRRVAEQARKRGERFERDRNKFSEHIGEMRAGELRWIHPAAKAYLKRFSDLGDDVVAHERAAERLGAELAAAAHEGFEAFLTLENPRPTALRMALNFARGYKYYAGDIIVAALAERLRLRDNPFADLPDERLMAGLFELWHSMIEEHAGLTGLAEALEAELRSREGWESAIRLFIVTQLRKQKSSVDRLYQLMRSEEDIGLATTLAIEWLETYSDLPDQTETELVDRVLDSPRRTELLNIFNGRLAQDLDDERRRHWDAVQIILDFEAARIRLESSIEAEFLWHLRRRSAGSNRENRSPVYLTPDQLRWIIAKFRGDWPLENRPTRTTIGDTNAWDASEYLKGLISRLGNDHSDEAIAAMQSLRDMDADGYTYHLQSVSAEQQRRRIEHAYTPPTVSEIVSVVSDDNPKTSPDLQAAMLEHLNVVQSMLKNSDVDWYRGFYFYEKYREGKKGPFQYRMGQHKDEESCRDELVKMLRTMTTGLEYIPESHGADDKRVDVVVRADERLILPIEIKGQWHRDLWTASDAQLDHLYVNDWRADRGIYLVLWFGDSVDMARRPDGVEKPTNASELFSALLSTSRAAQEGRVDIVVLDLTRPERG